MDEPLRVSGRLAIPATELRWRFSRASGPGGQGVNTTDARVQLTWCPATSRALTPDQREQITRRLAARLVEGCCTVSAAESRSQLTNRKRARLRLADLIAGALESGPPKRRRTRPTRGSTERRLDAKRRRSRAKQDRRRHGPNDW